MKSNIERRLQSLEAKAKPQVISTLVDFVKWCAEDEDTEMELSPEPKELVDETLKLIEEEITDL
jgi:hypothetical protein